MKEIRIGSCDFWSPFDIRHSVFYDIIVQCGYTPIIDNDNPDILFYSVFSNNHLTRKSPIKIWFSGENWSLPNFNQCNFALSGYYIDDERHFRLPLYVKYARNYITSHKYVGDTKRLKTYDQLSQHRNLTEIKPKTKFCNFVYSNCDPNREGSKFRQEFFHRLSQYKQVDSGGSCLNTIGHKIPDKLLFMSDYKFSISMENSNQMNGVFGYTTEKIFEPMLVDSIPIYWGNPRINEEFNSKAIINYHDYNDVDVLINKIIEIDNDDDLYHQYLSEPFIADFDRSPLNLNNIIHFFKDNILK